MKKKKFAGLFRYSEEGTFTLEVTATSHKDAYFLLVAEAISQGLNCNLETITEHGENAEPVISPYKVKIYP